MQDFMLETTGWKRFWQKFDELAEKVQLTRAQLLERTGDRLTAEVRQAIRRSGLHDSRGRVQSWQNPNIGSHLGYVAIRPDSVEVSAGGNGRQRLNAGALTNYLTSGHDVRGPSGRNKRYKPQGRMARVEGLGFYEQVERQAERIALDEAERQLEKLAKEMPK